MVRLQLKIMSNISSNLMLVFEVLVVVSRWSISFKTVFLFWGVLTIRGLVALLIFFQATLFPQNDDQYLRVLDGQVSCEWDTF